jgi:hypothetical protein
MTDRPQMRRMSLADLEPLQAAAASDNHIVIFPSHVAEQAGEIVGYASICMVPLLFCWVHSEKVKARDSFRLLREVEAEAARISPAVVLPCAQTSPFHPLMHRLGYKRLGPADWHFKSLTKV